MTSPYCDSVILYIYIARIKYSNNRNYGFIGLSFTELDNQYSLLQVYPIH